MKVNTGNKRSQEVIDGAERDGWHAEFTGGGHVKLTKPGRPAVYCGVSPGDKKAVDVVRRKLRRAEQGIVPWRRDQES